MTNQPLLRSETEGRVVAIAGDLYRFLATGDETGGRYAMWEATVFPGGGPPPHIHSREEEAFYVLEGTITFYVGDERRVAPAGTFASMPIGSLHCFRNESDSIARMLITVAPAGLEKMFLEIGAPMSLGDTPPPLSPAEVERILTAAPRYGVEMRLPTG